jgi:hypothetical protein
MNGMNIDDEDLTPSGASLPLPVAVNGQTVGTFTTPAYKHPDDLWQPFTRPTSQSSDGSQGSPLGSLRDALRPGHGFEDEPTDDAEKASQRTAQHIAAGQQLRSALRGGIGG